MMNLKLKEIQENFSEINEEYNYDQLNATSLFISLNCSIKFMEGDLKYSIVVIYQDDNEEQIFKQGLDLIFEGDFSYLKDGNIDKLKENLNHRLLNIAIGTLRGVIFLKTKGKKLAKYPLPLFSENVLKKNE